MSVTGARLLDSKLRLLQMHFESRVGHIGGNLSCMEMLMTLYHDVMGENDGFVLSKGHAAGALYTVLWSLGRINDVENHQADAIAYYGRAAATAQGAVRAESQWRQGWVSFRSRPANSNCD